MARLAVIIPAAGSGSRMGARIPKPFLKLQGFTVLEHTIRNFVKVGFVEQIVVATSKEWIGEVELILGKFLKIVKVVTVVEGGKERQDSINKALSVISSDIEIVAVHDAVRPFISEKLIKECAEVAYKYGGAIIAVPAKDTIKEVNGDLDIINTPNRSMLWQAQTPQIFRTEILVRAYYSAQKENFIGTDDASLVERIGEVVKVVEGDRENLKITYPIDLRVAELILNKAEAL